VLTLGVAQGSFTGALEDGCAPVIRVGFNFLFFLHCSIALSKNLLCCTCLRWVTRGRVFCWAKTVVIAFNKDPLLQGMVGRRDEGKHWQMCVSKVASLPGVPAVGFAK